MRIIPIFLFFLSLLFASCINLKKAKSEENSTVCGVPVEESQLYKEAYKDTLNPLLYAHPGIKEANEASSIRNELILQLKEEGINIKWSAGAFWSNIYVYNETDTKQQEKITCLLKDIMVSKHTKPIYLTFYKAEEIKNLETGVTVIQKEVVSEIVIE